MSEPRTHHRQVHLARNGREADVDEGIAPLLAELWDADIDTMLSCQRHMTGKVWITFATAQDAERFLNIVVWDGGNIRHRNWSRAESWYFGAFGTASGPLSRGKDDRYNPAGWEFHVTTNDDSFANTGGPGEIPAFRLEIAVLFPRRDVKRVLGRLREFNAATVPSSQF